MSDQKQSDFIKKLKDTQAKHEKNRKHQGQGPHKQKGPILTFSFFYEDKKMDYRAVSMLLDRF
jgi:hypothetical protein